MPKKKDNTTYKGYKKEILEKVSKALGHNRIDVVANHYMDKKK